MTNLAIGGRPKFILAGFLYAIVNGGWITLYMEGNVDNIGKFCSMNYSNNP
jgi:hypothetical protein